MRSIDYSVKRRALWLGYVAFLWGSQVSSPQILHMSTGLVFAPRVCGSGR